MAKKRSRGDLTPVYESLKGEAEATLEGLLDALDGVIRGQKSWPDNDVFETAMMNTRSPLDDGRGDRTRPYRTQVR